VLENQEKNNTAVFKTLMTDVRTADRKLIIIVRFDFTIYARQPICG
jgi:hypothetical protein